VSGDGATTKSLYRERLEQIFQASQAYPRQELGNVSIKAEEEGLAASGRSIGRGRVGRGRRIAGGGGERHGEIEGDRVLFLFFTGQREASGGDGRMRMHGE
jgi:hypothetical protein